MTHKVGLTGGIGSGKSEVAKVFALLGADIYEADLRAKQLIDENDELKSVLIQTFGEKIYKDSKIDRKAFASIIFKDKTSLDWANSLIHPFVFRDFEKWVLERPNRSYLVMEAAILFESKASSMMDKVITVISPLEVRIERIMKRDSCAKQEVLQRMQHQMPEEDKLKLADYIIYNDDRHLLTPRVLELHHQFLAMR